MTYEQYENEFSKIVCRFNSHELKAWNHYKEAYKDIPLAFRLKILLEVIYTRYHFIPDEFQEYLNDILNNETAEIAETRIIENTQRIKDMGYNIDSSGMVSIYRGQTNESECIEDALSWTCDKDVAMWFATRLANTKQVKYSHLYSAKAHINDILAVTNDRHEKEIIVTPDILSGCLFDLKKTAVKYSEKFMREWMTKREAREKEYLEAHKDVIPKQEKQTINSNFIEAQKKIAQNLYEQGLMTHENYLELCNSM